MVEITPKTQAEANEWKQAYQYASRGLKIPLSQFPPNIAQKIKTLQEMGVTSPREQLQYKAFIQSKQAVPPAITPSEAVKITQQQAIQKLTIVEQAKLAAERAGNIIRGREIWISEEGRFTGQAPPSKTIPKPLPVQPGVPVIDISKAPEGYQKVYGGATQLVLTKPKITEIPAQIIQMEQQKTSALQPTIFQRQTSTYQGIPIYTTYYKDEYGERRATQQDFKDFGFSSEQDFLRSGYSYGEGGKGAYTKETYERYKPVIKVYGGVKQFISSISGKVQAIPETIRETSVGTVGLTALGLGRQETWIGKEGVDFFFPFKAFSNTISDAGLLVTEQGIKRDMPELVYAGAALQVGAEFIPKNILQLGAYKLVGGAYKFAPKITSLAFLGIGVKETITAESPKELVGGIVTGGIGAVGLAADLGLFEELKASRKRFQQEMARRKEIFSKDIGILSKDYTKDWGLLGTKDIISKPLSFDLEIKIGEGKELITKILSEAAARKGISFKDVPDIDREFVIGQTMAKIRNYPEKFIPEIKQIALERVKEAKLIEEIPAARRVTLKRFRKFSDADSLFIKDTEPKSFTIKDITPEETKGIEVGAGKQKLILKLKTETILKEPAQIIKTKKLPMLKEEYLNYPKMVGGLGIKESEFVKVSQIERLSYAQKQYQILKQDLGLNQKQTSKFMQPELQKYAVKEEQKQKFALRFKEIASEKQRQRFAQKYLFGQALKFGQGQRFIQTQKFMQREMFKKPLIEKQIEKQIRKKKLLSFGNKLNRRLTQDLGVSVFKIRKGKKIYLGRGLTKASALDLGAKFVLGDLTATFGIEKSTLGARELDIFPYFERYKAKFRKPTPSSKLRKFGDDLFVQKQTGKGGRLAFEGELAEIQTARKHKMEKYLR